MLMQFPQIIMIHMLHPSSTTQYPILYIKGAQNLCVAPIRMDHCGTGVTPGLTFWGYTPGLFKQLLVYTNNSTLRLQLGTLVCTIMQLNSNVQLYYFRHKVLAKVENKG